MAKWKKNLLKVPESISKKIEDLDGMFVVAGVKLIPGKDIDDGVYNHLQISRNENGIQMPESIEPPAASGRWSKTNIGGKVEKLKHLPKVTKTFSFETPNFGDASTYGTHTVYQDRQVYQVKFIPPKHLRIKLHLLEERPRADDFSYLIKFEISQPLTKTQDNLASELLYNLNVLQENTGVSDVFPSETPLEDYVNSIQLEWEIFPPGERGADIQRLAQGRRFSPPEMAILDERYDVLRALQPTDILKGNSGFQRYFGAKFADDLVVFENLRYGNAVYVMFEDWQNLSQKSRLDLLASDGVGFNRIPHTDGWEKQLRFVVQNHLRRRLDR